MLETRSLSKRFRSKEVLHSISLRLDAKVYGLLGPNGAGKTTLIRCLTGLYEPQQGDVLYGNEPIRKSRMFRRDLGYLPQAFGMFPELTLYEMMDYICAMKGIAKARSADEIMGALARVNLDDRAKDRVRTLSGGMIRRAGIAQAIMGGAKVLLLDEPTAGLDPGERARFKNIVGELRKDRMILISTHIVEDVDACCSSVIVIDEGRVLFAGSCAELRKIATDKVYLVDEGELQSIVGDSFVLRVSEVEGSAHQRILTRDKQDRPGEAPTLEDGYMCLVKGLV